MRTVVVCHNCLQSRTRLVLVLTVVLMLVLVFVRILVRIHMCFSCVLRVLIHTLVRIRVEASLGVS